MKEVENFLLNGKKGDKMTIMIPSFYPFSTDTVTIEIVNKNNSSFLDDIKT